MLKKINQIGSRIGGVLEYWMTRVEQDIRSQKLRRKSRDAENPSFQITGLCEGLGDYFQTSPWVFRGAFIAGAFLTSFWVAIAYIGMVLFIPTDTKRIEGPYFDVSEEKETTFFDICENCSTAVKEGSLFCHKCGNKLN